MRPTDPDERRRVRVQYVPRGYGLALTITDDPSIESIDSTGPTPEERQAAASDVTIEDETARYGDVETNDGYLTVIASGVTTLELRRPDGESSILIWDESEVAWDSLIAG